jgi:hypothetical protein
MANLLSTNVSGRLYTSGYVDTNVNGAAFRFYDGTTFRGGLGLDDWAHSGSAADITMYVAGAGTFYITTNSIKRHWFNAGEVAFRTYAPDLNYKTSFIGGDQLNTYYGSGSATLYVQYHNGSGGNFNVGAGKLTVDTAGTVIASGSFRAPIFYDSNDTTYYLDPNSSTSGYFAGTLRQNVGKYVRDSYYRTISGYGDYYSGGNAGWTRVAEIRLTSNCSGAVLYGTLYDHRYDGADAYQISIVARAECNFTSDNESHYINVGCTITGSTAYSNYRDKIRVLLIESSAGSRKYEVQFYETNWNHNTWQLESNGWTVLSSAEAPGASVGGERVNYISNQNADNVRANSAVYAPILYDSADTGFYLDPNGTSNLNKFSDRTMGFNGMNPMSANSPYAARYNASVNYRTGSMGYATVDLGSIGSNWGSGFIDSWSSPGQQPNSSTSHWVGLQSIHYGHQDGTNFYGFQMVSGADTNRFYLRAAWPTPLSWREIITSGNIGSQSVNYATTAGTATSAGSASVATSAGSVDGLTINNSGDPINPDNVTQNQIGYNTSVSLYGQTDGGLYSSAYSSSWIHQIYGDFRTGQIAIRGKNANTWQDWRYVLDDKNIGGYAVPYGNMTSSTGLNDNKLYLRTNGDNNHYLWNAADDWEELVYYTGTGFRVKGSTGTVSAAFTDSGISIGSSGTLVRSFDAQGYLRIYGSSTNFLGIGPYNNNGWAYFENSGNGNGIYFNTPGRYAFDNGDITPYNDAENSLGAPSYRWSQVYTSGWLRQYGAQGMYNQDYGTHFYSNSGDGFVVTGSGGVVQLQFRSNHQSTLRGYVYADTSNNIGFLNNGGGWSFRTASDKTAYVHGQTLTINADNAGWSSIFMNDGDEGAREIHCNSNRIGFLTQAGSWGSWCDDDGGWNSVGNISGNYLYSNYSVRVGEIWGFGGLYRSSGAMLFGTENAGWSFRSGNSEKVYIATDGNIYMAWAGAYISTLLDAKQNASTAINTGNIGSQSVNYATSAGSSSSSSRSSALDIVGYGSGNMTYYQSSGTFAGQSGWAGYFISNHGDGATYYNQTIIMPFWGAPQYSRLQGGTFVGPYTFWSTENLNDYAPNMNQYVRTSDNVTFNTTTAPTILVNNHSDNTKGYRIHNTSGSSVSAMFTNSSNQLVIAAGAVDQINLNKKVYVNGVALGVNVSPSATAGRIDASNDIVAYSSSDERLKYNITPIENAIDKVKSLNGVEFDWKPEYKHAHGYEGHDTGIIAQQVQEVIPSAVRTNDTGFLAVRYEKLIGLLIEANKELAARVEELEKKLG